MELRSAVRWLEARVGNPILRRLLTSVLHWPFSNWYCVLEYSTDDATTAEKRPLAYTRSDDIVHIVAVRERSDWWTTFRGGASCTLYLGGKPVPAMGEVVTNAVKHQAHVTDFLHPVPALSGPGGEASLGEGDFTNYVLVEFSLHPDATDTTPATDDEAEADSTTEIPVEAGGSE